MLDEGDGIKSDKKEALKYYQMAAENDNADAIEKLKQMKLYT